MNKLFSLTLLSFSLSVFNSVSADEVILKNGSRLLGEVLNKDGSYLEFKTPFAGTLKINWTNIVELILDKPVKLMLDDQSIIMADKLKNKDDLMTISQPGEAVTRTIKQTQVAYINPDPWRLGKGYKMSGYANVSLKSQHGNTDKDQFDMDGKIAFRRVNDRLTFRGEYEDDKSNNIQSSLNWLFLGKYDYFVNKKTYLGGSALFEHDEFSDLELRETYGLFVGHQYFESKQLNLDLEVGLAQVYEDFIESEDNDFLAGTWSLKYDQYFFAEFVQLYHRQLGRLDLENTNKYIFKSWTGARFPLAFGFSVSGEVQADYDSQPAADAHRTDTTYLFKLGYEF